MPVFTSSIEVTADYPTIKPSLNLNFARARALDPRITFTRASVGTYVGRDGLIKTAGDDEARFDHDPDTLESLGLLIEESRTNHITNSNAPLSAAGSGDLSSGQLTLSVVTNIVSPDGTTSGVAQFNGNGTYRFGFASGGIAQQAYAGSMWVRAVSGTASFAIDVNDFNNLGFDAGLQTVGEEWKRFVVASQRSDSVTYRFMDLNLDSSNLYIWGPQLEDGAFPTSLIPTSGAAVTRALDNSSVVGQNFLDFYNFEEGTLLIEGDRAKSANSMGVTINDLSGPSDNRIEVRFSGGSLTKSRFVLNSGGTGYYDDGTLDNLNINKQALGFKLNDVRACVNGTLGALDTLAVMSVNVDQLEIGRTSAYGGIYTGRIRSLQYYPKRLTDAQLQLLTS